MTAAHRHGSPPDGLPAIAADLVDAASVARLLDATRPQAVVHAAVLGRADLCAARPHEAELVNARLPGFVAQACRERGLRLIALSTDLVFDGGRAHVSESDPAHPLSVYGRTKLEGEQAVLAAWPRAAVVRVALVHGRGHGPRATSSESVPPRAAGRAKNHALQRRVPHARRSRVGGGRRGPDPGAGRGDGLYHLGGPERLSRFELGRRVARAFGLSEDGLVPGSQAEHAGPDRRAPDVSLDSSRARRELGWEPRPLDPAIRESRP